MKNCELKKLYRMTYLVSKQGRRKHRESGFTQKTFVYCKSYRKRSLVFLSSFCSFDQHFGDLKQIYKCGVYWIRIRYKSWQHLVTFLRTNLLQEWLQCHRSNILHFRVTMTAPEQQFCIDFLKEEIFYTLQSKIGPNQRSKCQVSANFWILHPYF